MIRALLYLRVTSLWNRLASTVRRLRQPKYLMGAVVAVAYFYFFFFRRGSVLSPSGYSGAGGAPPQMFDPLFFSPMVGAIVLVVLLGGRLILAWLSPEGNPGLRFTEPEICFLFPAPMTRRALIHYNLLNSQFTVLVSALCLTLVANRWPYLGGNPVTHAIGWWIIISTVNLQFIGTPLTVAQLTRRGVSAPRRRAIGLCALCVFLIASAVAVVRHALPPSPADLSSPPRFVGYAVSQIDVGPLHWLLALFKVAFGPFLAPDWHSFLLALGPALLLLALEYLWIVRMEISFEEGAITLAHKSAQVIAARRSGQRIFSLTLPKARREPFRLADRGWPELAFFWKNMLSTWSGFKPRTWLLAAGAIILGCNWLAHQPAAHSVLRGIGFTASMLAGYTLVLGPQYARQDLRSDLANADILRSYPLAGWRVVLGELMAPVAILGGLWWLELLTIGLTLPGSGDGWMTPGLRLPFFLCLGLVAPMVSALQLLIPNAGAVVFPAWLLTPRNRTAGIEAIGQRLIFMFGQILATAIALLPAVLAAGVLIFATQWLIGTVAAMAVATIAVLVILGGELWIGIWWLGQRFETFDPATELRS